jgi:hypothetical protein
MPQPTANQGHIDALLTTISVAYMQQDSAFVAPGAFPTVPVNHKTDIYWVYPRDAFYRDDVGPRPLRGRSPRTGHDLTTASYACTEEGLSAAIDDSERANWSPGYDGERAKIRLIMGQHMIHRDKRFVSSFMKTGVWTTDIAGHATLTDATHDVFWNLGTSLPSKTIRSRSRGMTKLTGYGANCLILGSDVEQALIQHPDFIDRVKYTQGALSMDLGKAAEYFAVDSVRVATAINTTSEEGQAYTSDFIVGPKNALLVYAAPEPGLEVPSAGYVFAWTGLLGEGASSPAAVERFREEQEHSDVFEARTAYDMRVVAPDLGVFFSGLVQ